MSQILRTPSFAEQHKLLPLSKTVALQDNKNDHSNPHDDHAYAKSNVAESDAEPAKESSVENPPVFSNLETEWLDSTPGPEAKATLSETTLLANPAAVARTAAQDIEAGDADSSAVQALRNGQDTQQDVNPTSYEEGYKKGYSAGMLAAEKDYAEKAERTYAQVHTQLNRLLAGIESVPEQLVESYEDQLVAIAYTAAAKIVGQQQVKIETVKAMILEVAKEFSEQQDLAVHLSADDYQLLQQQKDFNAFETDLKTNNIQLQADNRVRLGGCIIETQNGTLDARLDIQLERLKQAMLTIRQQRLSHENRSSNMDDPSAAPVTKRLKKAPNKSV